MAASFEDVLKHARSLSAVGQAKLIDELTNPNPRTVNADGSVRTLYDALSERGLIGFMKDAPPDLSTNPKYMEGFGQSAE